MGLYWFTTYKQPDWRPEMGYNKPFKDILMDLRRQFGFQRTTKIGVETSDKWVPYLLDNERVFVNISKLVWNLFTTTDGIPSPYFTLDTRIAKALVNGVEQPFSRATSPPYGWNDIWTDFWRWLWTPIGKKPPPSAPSKLESASEPIYTPGKVFWNHTIILSFPIEFPAFKPEFTVKEFAGRNGGDPHSHHIMGDGRFCMMVGADDWNPMQDTVVSALNAALGLIVKHVHNYGW